MQQSMACREGPVYEGEGATTTFEGQRTLQGVEWEWMSGGQREPHMRAALAHLPGSSPRAIHVGDCYSRFLFSMKIAVWRTANCAR
jgi:hypothetical protein